MTITTTGHYEPDHDTNCVTCPECGETTHIVTVDYGIGAYEYWGAAGVHHNYQNVTACCEADPNQEISE